MSNIENGMVIKGDGSYPISSRFEVCELCNINIDVGDTCYFVKGEYYCENCMQERLMTVMGDE